MFSDNVNQTYNLQDATLEILIMLAGAFLLGCLLCWLIRKLIGLNEQENHSNMDVENIYNSPSESQHKTISKPPQSLTENLTQKSDAHYHNTTSPTHYSTPRIDDLTKISGINADTENELRDRGIKSYIDLRDSNKQTLLDILKTDSGKLISVKEAQTWPHQASLAAKGDWEKLTEYQKFMKSSKETPTSSEQAVISEESNQSKNDDLKIIEGIGPKIEEVLNNEGIKTFKDLRKSDRDTLKAYLDNAGNRFRMHEPESWPHQAGMAERGEWEELKIYQEFMDGGREIPSVSAFSKIDVPVQPIISDIESEFVQELSQDDLKKIEGIGPKIEEVLKKEGITSFKKLHETDRDTLKSYLDKAGSQFKMHEPESWPHQAGMAATGQWEELKIYQEFMDGGREVPSATASAQFDNTNIEPSIKVIRNEYDDLRKIEGIGPKIQELLNDAKIKTYKDLKESNSIFIKDLLDSAGPQYRMHDPDTWPKQAEMAHEGNWEELKAYQEEIIEKRAKDALNKS